MRIIYIANDGMQFNNEYDCKDYEWKLKHPHLKDIHIFDKDGEKFVDVLSEDAYTYSDKIVITSSEALNDLQALSKYAGYCYYEHINKVGEWKFDEGKNRFIMID